MLRLVVIFLLAAPLSFADAGNFVRRAAPPSAHFIKAKGDKEKPEKPPARGNAAGDYGLLVTGHYLGAGTATVGATITLTATVREAGTSTEGTLAASDLAITNGYFKGDATVMGIACSIEGRIDLPSAEDDEQTRKQAITGRITGTFKDANGNVGRIVAVQKVAAPDIKTPPHPKGPAAGGGNAGGDGGGPGTPPPPPPPHPKGPPATPPINSRNQPIGPR